MVAEIILVPAGSDLDAGKANAQHIARSLAGAGVKVREQISLCSDVKQLQQAISTALGRSNVVVTLGGMNEASGYLTKNVLSEGLSLPLEQNGECLSAIKGYCHRTGEPYTLQDDELARLPRGAVPFPGSYGKVPGCVISSAKQHIVMLPDTPQEVVPMCNRYVIPFLTGSAAATTVTRIVRTYGVQESAVRETLGDLLGTANPAVTVQKENNEVLIRVAAHAPTGQQAAALCTIPLRNIVDRMGDAAYGLDVDSLQSAVVSKMNKKSLDIAIAEAGTDGMLTRVLGETDGGQDILRYSVAVDTDEAKAEKLSIKPKLLKKRGGVSEFAAVAMASGAREKANTNIGVAVCASTGDGTNKKIPAGLVYIAVCDADNVYVKKLVIGDGAPPAADVMIDAALSRALNMVRLFVDYLPEKYPASIPLAEALDGKTVTDKESYEDVPADNDAAGDEDVSFGKRLLGNFIIRKADEPKQKVKKFIFLLAVIVFFSSVGYLGYYYYDTYIHKKMASDLENIFAFGDMEGVEISPDFPRKYNKKFAGLWSINPDVVAFVSIEDTQVKYPVVQSTDNDYYLRRDFYGKNNNHGVPFMDYRVDVKRPSENLLIYGHNMKDGTIFGELIPYKDVAYYRQHPIVDLSTIYGDGRYKIFSVFITNAYESQGPVFAYHDFINAKADGSFMRYVDQVKVRSLINTTVDVQDGDELLTLSTCTYEFKDARFVIVARKVRDGEDDSVDTAGAAMNPQPLMPDIWYKTFGGAKPEGLDHAEVITSTTTNAPSSTPVPSPAVVSSSRQSSSTSSSQAQSSSSATSPEDASRLAAESAREESRREESRQAAREAAAASKAESDAAVSKAASDAEASRVASEAEASRVASEAEASRVASEAEASRVASEAAASKAASDAAASSSALEAQNMSLRTAGQDVGAIAVYANGSYLENDPQDMIARIVQSEIGANFNTEAIKAQAVAAYTFIAQSNSAGTTPSVVMASKADKKIQNAVAEVIGQGIYYKNRLAFTPYHATSAGSTTSSAAVWGGSYPYLVPVDSSIDENAANFMVNTTMTRDKVEGLIRSKLGIEPSGDPDSWFEVLAHEGGGYNGAMAVCGETKSAKTGSKITGRLLRESVLSLRSANFTVEYDSGSDKFTFTTYGYGHGVGMSQTGANLYAAEGWSYIDILEHYYPGTVVK